MPYAFWYTTAPSFTTAMDRPGIVERSILEATNASTRAGSTRASPTRRVVDGSDPDETGRSGAAHVDASSAHTAALAAKPVRRRCFRVTRLATVKGTDVHPALKSPAIDVLSWEKPADSTRGDRLRANPSAKRPMTSVRGNALGKTYTREARKLRFLRSQVG